MSEAISALADIQIEEWRPDCAGAASLERDVDMLGEVLHAVVHAGGGVGFVPTRAHTCSERSNSMPNGLSAGRTWNLEP